MHNDRCNVMLVFQAAMGKQPGTLRPNYIAKQLIHDHYWCKNNIIIQADMITK